MKANELRIGNWVKYDSNEKVTFTMLEHQEINGFTKWIPELEVDDYFKLNPIPLTAEWFLKLGFNYHNPFKDEDSDFYVFQIKTSTGESITFGYASDVSGWFTDRLLITVNIYYVHQLQNLYYALIGEELKLKEI
jgi:hypothetical protein